MIHLTNAVVFEPKEVAATVSVRNSCDSIPSTTSTMLFGLQKKRVGRFSCRSTQLVALFCLFVGVWLFLSLLLQRMPQHVFVQYKQLLTTFTQNIQHQSREAASDGKAIRSDVIWWPEEETTDTKIIRRNELPFIQHIQGRKSRKPSNESGSLKLNDDETKARDESTSSSSDVRNDRLVVGKNNSKKHHGQKEPTTAPVRVIRPKERRPEKIFDIPSIAKGKSNKETHRGRMIHPTIQARTYAAVGTSNSFSKGEQDDLEVLLDLLAHRSVHESNHTIAMNITLEAGTTLADSLTSRRLNVSSLKSSSSANNQNGIVPGEKPLRSAQSKQNAVEASSETEDQMTCKIPKLDPFDPSIMAYVRHEHGIECERIQPDLTYVDEFNYLHYNVSEVKRIQAKYKLTDIADQLRCEFNTFERSETKKHDNSITHDEARLLLMNKPVPIEKDFVRVACAINKNYANDPNPKVSNEFNEDDWKLIYFNLHALVANRTALEFGNETDSQLSVLLFLIDSTSFSMAKRNLPLTYRYLSDIMGTFFFRGYNKIADNSFPNIIPWLTGKRVHDQQPGMLSEIDEDLSEIQYDHWPLIWKNFSSKGYVTSFNEDVAEWGLFHLGAKGFARKPVEHSYRPLWMSIWADKFIKPSSSELCFGNQPKVLLLLDIMRRVHRRYYRNKLKFGYNFFTEICHANDFDLERADEMFRDFLKEMHEGGFLNHTVLFFSSDHGHRASEIRQTLVGLLEERLPMTSVTFPKWFLASHPKLARNLKINSKNRLTSNFDYYETFVDILNADYDGSQLLSRTRGMSWLHAIPANRTCTQAGIPQQYCTCQESQSINATDELVVQAGIQLIGFINKNLRKYRDVCVKLRFGKIVRAEMFQVNEKVVNGLIEYEPDSQDEEFDEDKEAQLKMFRVAVQALPSNGIFEATLQHNAFNDRFRFYGGINDIQRLDRYGSQSDCIPASAKAQRKMCFCKNKL